jgi:hypothetical protein
MFQLVHATLPCFSSSLSIPLCKRFIDFTREIPRKVQVIKSW